MDTTQEPLEAIDAWQKWYKENKLVAELDEPLITKDSREAMHDTTNAVDSAKAMWMQKAQEYFADTIAEFQYELSGKEIYKAFYAAAMDNMDCVEKEYKKAKQLVNMLRYNNVAP